MIQEKAEEISVVQARWKARLKRLEDCFAQCSFLLFLGLSNPGNRELRREDYRIPGCQTAIWQKVNWENGRISIRYDSDSVLVLGVLSIFQELYEEREIREIRENPPEFLEEISEEVIYREIRENGLRRYYENLFRAS